MDRKSIIDKAFTDGFNEAVDLYNADRLDECIEKTRTLLDDGTITRYHRMRALALLASTLGDWEEANDCFVKAETMWRVVRRWHPEGEDPELDKFMEDLRESLDQVGAELERTEHEDSDLEDDVSDNIATHEEHVKDATAALESLEMTDAEIEDEPPADVPAIKTASETT